MDDILRFNTSLKSMKKAVSLVELEKEAAKVTFSPAMDESPALKGKQSKLPDQIQAAILKKKKQKTKQAALAMLAGAGLGAYKGLEKGEKSGRGTEGAVTGGIGGAGGSILGGWGGGAVGMGAGLASLALLSKTNPKAYSRIISGARSGDDAAVKLRLLIPGLIGGTAGSVGGGIAGYKALTKGVDKKKESSAKATFSPAMDESPLLKGKQSKLPDKIQAAILKKKGKKKEGSVMVSGIQQASMAIYTDTYGNRLVKTAGFPGWLKNLKSSFVGPPVTQNVAQTGFGTAVGGALLGAGKDASRIRALQKLPAAEAQAIRVAAAEGKAAKAAGKTPTSAQFNAMADAKQLDRLGVHMPPGGVNTPLPKGARSTPLPENPFESWQTMKDYGKAYGPSLANSALQSGALGGIAGAGAQAAMNLGKGWQKAKGLKEIAPYAALGAGGLGMYALTS